MGPIFGVLLCIVLGVARPLHAAHQTLKDQDVAWLAFFACATIFVLPPLAILPAWVPLRYEVMVGLLLVFGASDGRGSLLVFRRYVAPILARIPEPTWPEDMDAWFAALERVAVRCTPASSSPDAITDEGCGGNGDDDEPGEPQGDDAREPDDGTDEGGGSSTTTQDSMEIVQPPAKEVEVDEEPSSPQGSSTRRRPRAGMKT